MECWHLLPDAARGNDSLQRQDGDNRRGRNGEVHRRDDEEKVAAYIEEQNISKPIVAYIAGKSAPEGKRMGHAGAIISGNVGTAQGKIDALSAVGANIAETPWDIPDMVKEYL